MSEPIGRDKSGPLRAFVLREPTFWGDYGDVLRSGFAHRDPSDGTLRLVRAGPFLPPITYPSRWKGDNFIAVVSDDFRAFLEGLRLPEVKFAPVFFEKIVKIDWHLWDFDAGLPPSVPQGGEPENYLMRGKQSRATASSMPRAWEILLPPFPVKIKLHQLSVNDGAKPDLEVYRCQSGPLEFLPLVCRHSGHGPCIANSAVCDALQVKFGSWINPIGIEFES